MIRKSLYFIAALLFSSDIGAQVYSQLYSGRQEMFLEAESYHLFEEYNEALPLYIELLKDKPYNAFLNYRAGTSYLNIPGEKEMAIEYLERAISDMDNRDRRYTFRTTKAPLDALFFLGNAYHINYQFDKALEMYNKFKDSLDPSIYNIEIVDEHIKAAKNAIESTKKPVFFLKNNLGERINTRFSETNPVVSGNKEVLVFTRKLPFYDGVFFAQKEKDGEWSWPMEITPQIGSDGDCYPASLTWDGKELYLYKSDDLVGNIYVSSFVNGQWTPIKKLNENINTRYWESHASISKDGNTLYFSSNRPGGYGGLDIYYSKRNINGDWGPAINMGKVINTSYNEDTPFISEDGETLYFSSYGHYNIGGYDIFYSTILDDGNWSIPINAGYGINTPDDDLFYNPVNNGIYAFVSKFDDEGFGSTDILRYEIFSETHPRKFQLKGIMGRQDGLQIGMNARIRVLDLITGDTVYSVRPSQLTGEYEMMVKAGEYEAIFSEEGHKDIVKPLLLPVEKRETEVTINTLLERVEIEIPGITEVITDSIILPKEKLPLKTLGIEQHHYVVTDDDMIRIEMRLERNTLLEAEKYLDGKLIDIEEIKVNRRRFNYELIPEPGINLLKFRYTDRDGDIIKEEVVISFHKPLPEEPPIKFRDKESLYPVPEAFIDAILPYVSEEMAKFLKKLAEEDNLPATAEELIRMILESSEEYGYDKYEIIDAAIKNDRDRLYQATEDFIDAILPYVSEEMAKFLKKLAEEDKLPATAEELIRMILESSEEYGYDKYEIIDALIKAAAVDVSDPGHEDEVKTTEEGGRIPIWWIILLAILLLGAFYYKERVKRN